MPTFNLSLQSALNTCADQLAYTNTLVSALGATRRMRIFRDAASGADPFVSGVEVHNVGVTGSLGLTVRSITAHGTTAGVTVRAAADLSTGTSCLRIEGGGNFVQFTLGLTGSGKEVTMPSSLTATTGIAFGALSINPPAGLPVADGSVRVGLPITSVSFINTTGGSIANQPITFGQAFKALDLPFAGAAVQLRKADATLIPTQIDVKATHADGSVRHAIISAVLPAMTAAEMQAMTIVRKTAVAATPAVYTEFTGAGLDAVVSITVAGVAYTASLAALLATAPPTWLAGDVATEWLIVAPLKSAGNVTHPLIHARFAVRGFKGKATAKIDVTIENTWVIPSTGVASGGSAWVNNSIGAVTYDAAITVAGTTVFTQTALVHFPYARWKKTFWWGAAPTVHIKHNLAYLSASKALPNYDPSIAVPVATIASNKTLFLSRSAPMKQGVAEQYMPNTGGRDDLAILPGWDARYLMSQDVDAKLVSMGQGDLTGSWGAHYRNQTTGLPVSIANFPYMTLLGNHSDCYNTTTQLFEDFPATVSDGNTNVMQTAHHPDMAFLPYLVTGDFYYLETLQFWANYCAFQSNPGLRGAGLGLFNPDETRGQAWSIRTMAHAAYITPDGHAQKTSFATILQNNFNWYDTNYSNSVLPEMALGIMYKSAIQYPANPDGSGATVGVATWQDDYFTSAVGRAVELGFTGGATLLAWKSKFSEQRMTSGANFCYIFAANGSLNVKDAGGTFYTTLNQIYINTPSITAAMRGAVCASQALADLILAKYGSPRPCIAGQIIPDGSSLWDGYANLMQPALAYATGPNAANAWTVYASTPGKASDIPSHPQFAILPRA
jgi:hypothetical protein